MSTSQLIERSRVGYPPRCLPALRSSWLYGLCLLTSCTPFCNETVDVANECNGSTERACFPGVEGWQGPALFYLAPSGPALPGCEGFSNSLEVLSDLGEWTCPSCVCSDVAADTCAKDGVLHGTTQGTVCPVSIGLRQLGDENCANLGGAAAWRSGGVAPGPDPLSTCPVEEQGELDIVVPPAEAGQLCWGPAASGCSSGESCIPTPEAPYRSGCLFHDGSVDCPSGDAEYDKLVVTKVVASADLCRCACQPEGVACKTEGTAHAATGCNGQQTKFGANGSCLPLGGGGGPESYRSVSMEIIVADLGACDATQATQQPVTVCCPAQ